MDFKAGLRTSFKVLIPLILGGLLLWYLYRDMDFTQVWRAIRKGVRYDIIACSLIFGLVANVIRGLRWCLLIDELGMPYKRSNAVHAVLGNYAVNLVLPRVGEIWRCGIVTRYDRIPFTKLFGTLLVDRVFDTLVVGTLTLILFVFHFDFFAGFLAKYPVVLDGLSALVHSVWIYVGLVCSVAFVWLVFVYMSKFAFVQKAKELLTNVWTGIKSVWLMKRKRLFLIYTLLIWVCYFFFFYITFFAFGFTRDLGVTAGLIAFAMSSLGVAAPVQGGIGAWHFMVIATLFFFGVNESDAGAFALVVHTAQTAWTGLCGLVSIVVLPMMNKKVES
ncbi:hypothetical protein Barb6XT_00192 [Bacteroidales bacterium Barb6XT]|nr:hypothetical protein Barb6XT_00192 [Bacteroidales bacterium Barb6XT]